MRELLQELIRDGWLKTPAIVAALRAIDRKNFVPEAVKPFAYENRALPIGWGQTISQPLTVAFMLEQLEPASGQAVLDIGYGSGWQTALLAHVVGSTGRVYALERVPELAAWGKENVLRAGFQNVQFFCADGSQGLPQGAPFDRIIAAASARRLPAAWKKQLKKGGRLVAPVGESIVVLTRQGRDDFQEQVHHGFAFVPFVTDKGAEAEQT